MNKKIIILIITLVILLLPNKIKAYELETESGYEYSKTLPESGYSYHHTECNGTKVKEDNVTYNEETKTFSINGITEQNNCKFYFNKNGEEIIRTYEVKATVLNGTIEGETTKVVRSNTDVTFTLNPTNGYGNPTVTCTNNQTGSVTNNTLTVSNITNDTVCTVEFKEDEAIIQKVDYRYQGEFWKQSYRENITDIVFEDKILNKQNELEVWDISENKNGKVIARIVSNQEDNTTYSVYIQSNGKIKANEDSSYLFGGVHPQWGGMFKKLKSIVGLEFFDTSDVINMTGMFMNAGSASNIFDVSGMENWNTSNVLYMNNMFSNAGNTATTFNVGNLGNWDTSNVKDMSGMFANSGYNADVYSLKGIDNWNTPNLVSTSTMFANAGYLAKTFEIDVSNFNVSNVTQMQGMFDGSGYNAQYFSIGDLSNWNTSKVTTMGAMFRNAGRIAAGEGNFASIGTLKIPSNCDVSAFAYGSFAFNGRIFIEGTLGDYDNMFKDTSILRMGDKVELIINEKNSAIVNELISVYGSSGNIYSVTE